MVSVRQAFWAMAVILPAGVFAQQTQPRIAGSVTSSGSVILDGVEMQPTAAASWPVVQGDEIDAASAPALFTAADGDLVTFERDSKMRVKTIENGQPYIYVQQGGVLFETKTPHLNICIANHLFVPSAGAKGVLRWEKSGLVSRNISTGQLLEQGERACDDQVAAPLANQSAGGTATGGAAGGTATAPTAAPGGVSTRISVVAAAVGAASAALGGAIGAFTSSCTTAGGCNHNPPSVSPSNP